MAVSCPGDGPFLPFPRWTDLNNKHLPPSLRRREVLLCTNSPVNWDFLRFIFYNMNDECSHDRNGKNNFRISPRVNRSTKIDTSYFLMIPTIKRINAGSKKYSAFTKIQR